MFLSPPLRPTAARGAAGERWVNWVSKGEQLLTPLIPATTKQMQITGMEMDLSGHLALTPGGYCCHLKGSGFYIVMHFLSMFDIKELIIAVKSDV